MAGIGQQSRVAIKGVVDRLPVPEAHALHGPRHDSLPDPIVEGRDLTAAAVICGLLTAPALAAACRSVASSCRAPVPTWIGLGEPDARPLAGLFNEDDAGGPWYGRCTSSAIDPAEGTLMPTRSQDPAEYSTLAERCAVAIADANWFRNMASRALRDGKPRGLIRAERARTAARIILMRAKQDAAMNRMIVEAAAAGRQPT